MPTREPLVFIHGLFGALSDNAFLVEYGDRHVFAPDLIGYGKNRSVDVSSLSLLDQVDHILEFLNSKSIPKANLIGHSVGGAIATLFAINYPDRVSSLVSVEGNMTPSDSFWSSRLAMKSVNEIQLIVDGYQADVAAWISNAGVQTSPETIRIASAWLDHQPASTLRAQAAAVVETTSDESDFLDNLRARLDQGLILHLVSGSNSRDSWHVPDDIEASAKSNTVVRDSGHLLMLESPSKFADVITRIV